MYRQTSNISRILDSKIVDHSAHYIFILDLTAGFSGVSKDNYKTQPETFKFGAAIMRGLTVGGIVNNLKNSVPAYNEITTSAQRFSLSAIKGPLTHRSIRVLRLSVLRVFPNESRKLLMCCLNSGQMLIY